MNATAKSENSSRLSRAELRRRWAQLADNPLPAQIPCKIELSERGAIVVSPPTIRHGVIQGFVTRELARQRSEGTTFVSCPVETEIGMRLPDVAWASPEFMEQHRNEQEFRVAPDLCIEVLAPTNTHPEMAEKIAAYLAAGAREVWVVDEDGVPEIHTSAGQVSASTLGFELPRPPAAVR